MRIYEKKYSLKSPYPYFGGKSLIAEKVWRRFGSVGNYVEPFFGSGAVLLSRPELRGTETINDMDGFVINFWRAIKSDPEEVIFWADYPESEADLRARHGWLANRKDKLLWSLEDPDSCDPKIAGWWVWGINQWIGSGFCSGKGPFMSNGAHIFRKTMYVPGNGFRFPSIKGRGSGIHRKSLRSKLAEYVFALSERLRHVRICCGDWKRVVRPSLTTRLGLTAVFLDPPYSPKTGRCKNLYNFDSDISHLVREWAIQNGENPKFRIALCGYEGEHQIPDSWKCLKWKARGGFANQREMGKNNNRFRERIWFSKHCL